MSPPPPAAPASRSPRPLRVSQNLPFAHAVQDAESATAQVPAMQSLCAARSAAAPVDGPAAQAVHAAPVPAMHWPATHAVRSSDKSFEVLTRACGRELAVCARHAGRLVGRSPGASDAVDALSQADRGAGRLPSGASSACGAGAGHALASHARSAVVCRIVRGFTRAGGQELAVRARRAGRRAGHSQGASDAGYALSPTSRGAGRLTSGASSACCAGAGQPLARQARSAIVRRIVRGLTRARGQELAIAPVVQDAESAEGRAR